MPNENIEELDARLETAKTAAIERDARLQAVDEWRQAKRDDIQNRQRELNNESTTLDELYYGARNKIARDYRVAVYGEDAADD